MNKIDFIKKCIPFADGFEFNEQFVLTPVGGSLRFDEMGLGKIGYMNWTFVWFPLLIVRAIEGINNADLNINITSNKIGLFVNKTDVPFDNSDYHKTFSINENIDAAKIAALEYVFEQVNL